MNNTHVELDLYSLNQFNHYISLKSKIVCVCSVSSFFWAKLVIDITKRC